MRTLLAIALGVLWAECLPAHAWEPTDKDFHVIDKSVKHPATRVKSWKRVHKPKPPPRCKPVVAAIGDSAKSEAAARQARARTQKTTTE